MPRRPPKAVPYRSPSISLIRDPEISEERCKGSIIEIAKALRDRQVQRTETDGWLIPGRHAGRHITPTRCNND